MPALARILINGVDQTPAFDLVSLHANEQLGHVYTFILTVIHDRGDITPSDILGKAIGVELALQDGVKRNFNGIVMRMRRGPRQGHRHEYQFEVQPDFALLGYRSDARIFQNKTVPQVFEDVVAAIPSLSWQFSASSLSHQPWEYCVQYQETDLDFLMRLLEQEGMYFYFEHRNGSQTKMHLLDNANSGVQASFSFNPNASASKRPHDFVEAWERVNSLVSGMAELSDFDFARPMQKREVRSAKAAGHAWDNLDLFFYPGEFDSRQEGMSYADIRMQALHARHSVYEGSTTSPEISIGKIISVQQHPVQELNGDFLVTSSSYFIRNRDLDSGTGTGASIHCNFTAIPATVPYRPQRTTPKSIILGPQTAFVVGPDANEIYTDKFGRIRVQFHWDRYGKPNEDTSCWIRVAQPWANQGFGFWALPRVGSEVVVQFLDGDPERPLVIGSVYNGENHIPYPQPDDMTKSGFRTFSTPNGGMNDYNELRFEDKTGQEEIYLQAQKDFNARIKNDATRMVGGHDNVSVEASQTIQVGDDRHVSVGKDQVTSIQSNHHHSVGANHSSIVEGDRRAQVGSESVQSLGDMLYQSDGSMGITAAQSFSVKTGMSIGMASSMGLDLKSSLTVAIEAATGLTLKCGGSFISLTPAGISIQGPLLTLNSGGAALSAQAANPAKPKRVQKAPGSNAIQIDQSPPVRPASQTPQAGSLAHAARSGAPFAMAG